MNTSFWGWLIGAAVVAGGLLLFLGMPEVSMVEAPEPGAELVGVEQAMEDASSTTSESSYWEPVTPTRTVEQIRQPLPAVPCSGCGNTHAIVQQPAPTTPCGDCGVSHTIVQQPVPQPVPSCGYTAPSVPLSSGCGSTGPIPPCAKTPCQPLSTPCCNSNPCGQGQTCVLERPGINRHIELCVDECTYIQLHSTVPHPICSDIRFAWSASKGSFLDPTASDPMFYAPTTQFDEGEDVWIVLTITGPDGMRYTDQVQVHVVNR